VVERGRGRGEERDEGGLWRGVGVGRGWREGKLGEKEKVDDKKERKGGRGGRSPLNETERETRAMIIK